MGEGVVCWSVAVWPCEGFRPSWKLQFLEERCSGIMTEYQYLCTSTSVHPDIYWGPSLCMSWHLHALGRAQSGPGATVSSTEQSVISSPTLSSVTQRQSLQKTTANPPARETRETGRPARCGKEGAEEPLGAVLIKDSDEQPIYITILQSRRQPCNEQV